MVAGEEVKGQKTDLLDAGASLARIGFSLICFIKSFSVPEDLATLYVAVGMILLAFPVRNKE
jgi:hypothetical protein